jgi:hypothetical protein
MNVKIIIITVIFSLSAIYVFKNQKQPLSPEEQSLTELQKWYEGSFDQIEDAAKQLDKHNCHEVLTSEEAARERGKQCQEVLKNHSISEICQKFPKERTSAGLALFLFLCGNESDYDKHTKTNPHLQ